MLKAFFKRIITEVIKELIAPELQALRGEISNLREEMRAEIAGLREEMHAEIGGLRTEIAGLREEMRTEIGDLKQEIRHIHARLDNLYNVVVRREEHASLQEDVKRLREDVEMLKRKA